MAKRSIACQEKGSVKEETPMFAESETAIDLNTLLGFSLANIRCFLQHFSKSLASFKEAT